MTERDDLADLRAWRDEFARQHGFSVAAVAATLRALDKEFEGRVKAEPSSSMPYSTDMVSPSANNELGGRSS